MQEAWRSPKPEQPQCLQLPGGLLGAGRVREGEVTGAGRNSEGAQSAGEAGLGDLEPGPGGGGGLTQARRGGAGEAGPGEREPLANRYLPSAHVPEREGQRQRGGPRGKEAGEAGAAGRASCGSPPPSRGLQTRPLPVGRLVGRSVGRWVSVLQLGSRLSGSEVGGSREWPAHLSCPERSRAPRSVGSPHSPRPPARSGVGAPAGALPRKPRAPRSENHSRRGGQCQ